MIRHKIGPVSAKPLRSETAKSSLPGLQHSGSLKQITTRAARLAAEEVHSRPKIPKKKEQSAAGSGNALRLSLFKSGLCRLECGLHFDNIRTHMKTAHADYERCPTFGCYEYFKFGFGLEQHLALDHADRLECEFCRTTFKNDKSLDAHVTRFHRCGYCGWSMNDYEREEHFGARCAKCGGRFDCVQLLDQHSC